MYYIVDCKSSKECTRTASPRERSKIEGVDRDKNMDDQFSSPEPSATPPPRTRESTKSKK